ncbi:MAG: cadmium-translocating P-type ATPase [Clostridia bacterium]|nr:cadmium-translocating P-type ATPase [Clostridia bacterium]
MSERKRELIAIIIGAVLLAGAALAVHLLPDLPWYAKLLIYAVPYLVLGIPIIIDAVHGLIGGEFLDENFLMTVASIGALAIGEGFEGVLVMLLYRIGELLQQISVGKSRDAVASLMDICPDTVNLETENGVVETDPESVHTGDVFIVRPGERIPIDGVIIEGSSGLNTAALTGESLPVDVSAGDCVSSGCISTNGMLRIKATCEYGDSTVARMLELIEGAAANKAKSEKFITKFARVYTPVVCTLALILAIIPPLFFGGEWKDWIYRALNFLVISCPCALVISVPLTFFGGIGGASKKGVLVKGSNCLESLAKCGTVVFDKTGTLTLGSFRLTGIAAEGGMTGDELLRAASAAESLSTHPIALCITKAFRDRFSEEIPAPESVREIAGQGISAVLSGREISAGNIRLMNSLGIVLDDPQFPGTVVHVAVNKKYCGYLMIEDEIKEGTAGTISSLRSEFGVRSVMLTGDRESIGRHIANEIGLDEVHADLLPENKVELLESIINDCQKGKTTAYVGDGINDAPVIARADVGFAMGGLGSDAAIEAADIVLMDDRIEKVPLAIRIAKRTVRIATENIVFALAVKLIVLILGALGYAEMWMAIIADVGVCLVAVLNAMRAMRII